MANARNTEERINVDDQITRETISSSRDKRIASSRELLRIGGIIAINRANRAAMLTFGIGGHRSDEEVKAVLEKCPECGKWMESNQGFCSAQCLKDSKEQTRSPLVNRRGRGTRRQRSKGKR